MTRAEFLNNLYRRLGALEKEQAEQYLTYYAEMLMDRMEEGMSEQEAVASMEDVETIASRILQDEGRADAPRPPQAPRFPDMPGGEAGQFTHVPQKRRRDWRRPAQAALWVIAAIVAVHAVGSRLAGRRVEQTSVCIADSSAPVIEEAVQVSPGTDFGFSLREDEVVIGAVTLTPDGITITGEGREVCVGPDGIYAYGTEDDVTSGWGPAGVTWEVPLDDGVNAVYVDWHGGDVAVQSWDGDSIRFQEFGGDLKESQKLRHEITGGQLIINDGGSGKSKLLLRIPQGHTLMDSIYIDGYSWDVYLDNVAAAGSVTANTSSGSVTVTGAGVSNLLVDTSSGNVTLRDVAAQHISVSTTSGDVALNSAGAAAAQISTSSGKVLGTLGAYETAWVETTSGDVNLDIAGAYELYVDTTSGDVGLALEGPEFVDVNTSSGDIDLLWPREKGFLLNFDSTSGTVGFPDGMDVIRTGDGYAYGAGYTAQVQVYTSSGDLRFSEK